jgi:thiosulfate/3-mercaptopyruvate sulfurtransferase
MSKPAPAATTDLLVTTTWLAEHLDDPAICILDMRKGDVYSTSHICGAVTHGASPFLRADGDVIGAEAFAALMSRLGVGAGTEVIAYDDGNNLFAARLWWVLNYYGYARVKVLDGGWDRWLDEGRPVESAARVPQAAQFVAHRDPTWIADSDYVQSSIGRQERVILDVRSDEEWTRIEATETTTVGRIPGAVHLVWSAVLDPDSKRFKPASQLSRMFTEAGVSPQQEVIPYCQAGIRAAHTVLALKIAGYTKVRNYEGSWAAWTREGRPREAPAAARAN